jgi:hypothetical protein
MEQEIWKPVKDFEGLYEVSSLGRVKSLDREVIYSDGRVFKYSGNIMKHSINRGYHYVNLIKNTKPYSKKVHRLVAEAFVPNPQNKTFIDHIDTDKDNNSADNLRWVTQSENMNNEITKQKIIFSMRNGLTAKMIQTKKDNGSIKVIYQYDLNGKFLRSFESISEAARLTGIGTSCICMCANKKSGFMRAGNYMWSYEKDKSISPYIDGHLRHMRRIVQVDSNMDVIRIFADKYEAAKSLNMSPKQVAKRCWRKSTSYRCNGVIILYEEDLINIKGGNYELQRNA